MGNNLNDLIILCREVDKYRSSPPIVYEVFNYEKELVKNNNNSVITSNIMIDLIKKLGLRSRFNPELSYYLLFKSQYEENNLDELILNKDKIYEFNYRLSNDFSIRDFYSNNGIYAI